MSMNPAQFDFTKRRWHWHHLPPEIAEHLAEAAAADELICVKLTESRAVYRFENLFIKISGSYRLKSQLMPAAREEYNTYCQLVKNNICTVKHLGWGRAGHYTALITEAWSDDAEDVLSYWYKLVYSDSDKSVFLDALCDFLHDTVNSPLHHGDFHLGNILYSPSLNKFTLVDLHNVSIGALRNYTGKAEMLRILVELRSAVRPQQMLELFEKAAGIDSGTAGKVIHQKLVGDRERLQHDWQRRRKQFLAGYSKFSNFTAYNGTVLLVQRDKLRRDLFDPAAAARNEYRTVRLSFAAALEQMLFSFYLSMLQVPHLAVAALAPDGTLYYPKLPKDFQPTADREWINSYNEYLLCMGLHLEDYHQWHSRKDLLLLNDFSSMLTSCGNRAMFQAENVNPHAWRISRH